jgi:hypothetical protein
LCKYLLYSTSTVCSKGTEPARFLSRALGKHSTRTVRVRVCTRLYSYEYSKCTVHNSVCNYILCSTADNPAERSSGQVRADTVLSSAKRSRRSPRASSPTMVSDRLPLQRYRHYHASKTRPADCGGCCDRSAARPRHPGQVLGSHLSQSSKRDNRDNRDKDKTEVTGFVPRPVLPRRYRPGRAFPHSRNSISGVRPRAVLAGSLDG